MLVIAPTLLGIYGIVVVALQAYAGVGSDRIGLAKEAIADDVLGVVASNAVGSVMGPLMEFAVFASALACLAAAVSPAARLLLTIGPIGSCRRHSRRCTPMAHRGLRRSPSRWALALR